jgi:hypothetical protein
MRWAGNTTCMGEKRSFGIKTWRKEYLDDPCIDEMLILYWFVRKQDGRVWTGFIWLRIWTSGELLWTRQWTFGFHKLLETSWQAKQLLVYPEGSCSIQLVEIPRLMFNPKVDTVFTGALLSCSYGPMYTVFIGVVVSVGIATGYGLDNRGIKVWFPAGAWFFSPLQHPDWLWGSPSLLSNGAGGRIPRIKTVGGEAGHSLPFSAEVKNGGSIPILTHMSSWHSA